MQLPRGTFREIKKNELVSSILEEFERTKFSGICSISSEELSGTLVFKSGKCILAKIQNKSGDAAWDILQKMSNHEVDAAISSLDEPQVQLALEFNKVCRIVKTDKTIPVTTPSPQKPAHVTPGEKERKPFPAPPGAAASVRQDIIIPKPLPVATLPLRPSYSFTPPQSPVKNGIPPPQARASVTLPVGGQVQPAEERPVYQDPRTHRTETPAGTEEPAPDSSNFENDIDTFDSLDLDNVTDKIRNDCKTMIKQLQLEHLMER